MDREGTAGPGRPEGAEDWEGIGREEVFQDSASWRRPEERDAPETLDPSATDSVAGGPGGTATVFREGPEPETAHHDLGEGSASGS